MATPTKAAPKKTAPKPKAKAKPKAKQTAAADGLRLPISVRIVFDRQIYANWQMSAVPTVGQLLEGLGDGCLWYPIGVSWDGEGPRVNVRPFDPPADAAYFARRMAVANLEADDAE
tara:strand:+ start:172 stop:519 length:348 start_codon:yes stop_codon:yes gene_type:complete